jgi:hypothetical protein
VSARGGGRHGGAYALGRTSRGAMLTSASAHIHIKVLHQKVDSECLEPCRQGDAVALFVGRHYDATPWTISFGGLQRVVCPFAKYFRKCPTTGKWQALSLQEFQLIRRPKPCKGTLELLAQSIDVGVLRCDGTVQGGSVVCMPKFVQNGKASTLYSAVDDEMPCLNVASIAALSETIRFVFVSHVPDGCRANKRLRAAVCSHLIAKDNILINPVHSCTVHTLHRIMSGALREEDLVGDVHASAVVHHNVSHHNAVVNAFRGVVEADFVWNVLDDPHPLWLQHTREVLEETIGRDIRGSLGDVDNSLLTTGEGNAKIDKIVQYVNGDIRTKQFVHYERNCGMCGSRQEALDNFTTACLEGGLVLDGNCELANKARWGSLHASESELAPGLMVHSIMPSAHSAAFAKWALGDPGGEHDDDHRAYIRSKCHRSKTTLTDNRFVSKCLASYWCGSDVYQLWRRLEFLDSHGAALMDLVADRTDPFRKCELRLQSMILNPAASHSLRTLWRHFELQPAQLELCTSDCFQILTSTVSQLKHRYRMLKDWPMLLIECVAATPAKRLSICQIFWRTNDCCLERLLAAKLKQLWPTAEAMAVDEDWWSAFGMFVRKARVTNMHIERLLAGIKKSVHTDRAPLMDLPLLVLPLIFSTTP